jgi:N-acetylglucosaminyl-diphospho-decaprenol L-rhamnosyltransferase
MNSNQPPGRDMSPRLSDVTVVIVTYNSAHCVPALAQALKDFPHVSVVDNASDDGCTDLAARLLPQARVVQNPRNLGFGAANNVALRCASTPYCLLLNPDCEISAEKALALLAVAQQHNDAAVVAPQLLDERGRPQLNYRWPANTWRPQGPGAEGLCCVGFACGAVLLLNMALMRPIGFFDEDFFLYYEDDDLCQRVFAAQKTILIAPQVTLVHASRGSVRGNKPWRAEYGRGYHHAQSKILYATKHVGRVQAQRLRNRVLSLALLALPLRLLLPAPKHVARLWGRVQGLWQMKL